MQQERENIATMREKGDFEMNDDEEEEEEEEEEETRLMRLASLEIERLRKENERIKRHAKEATEKASRDLRDVRERVREVEETCKRDVERRVDAMRRESANAGIGGTKRTREECERLAEKNEQLRRTESSSWKKRWKSKESNETRSS